MNKISLNLVINSFSINFNEVYIKQTILNILKELNIKDIEELLDGEEYKYILNIQMDFNRTGIFEIVDKIDKEIRDKYGIGFIIV